MALHPRAIVHDAASAKLPVAAEGPVSRILGRDDPAYRAVSHGGGFVLGNPDQRLRARLDRRGVVIQSRGAWIGLSPAGYGYGERLHDVGPVEPRAQANRVTYRRARLVEWYANGPLGIEQGFTLARRPAGRENGPLTLSLALSGNTRAALSHGAGGVSFTRQRMSLAYRGLIATDARGQTLPARIELHDRALLLRVDDRGATYPLQIDPSIEQEQAKLTASDGMAHDFFGSSVAISGDTIVVGAPQATVGGRRDQGAVYVFTRPAGGWTSATETAKLTASDGTYEALGASVAISGDTIVAGAPCVCINSPSDEAVYVFVRSGSSWTPQARLTASDGADGFGTSVAISGNTVVTGAPYATVNGNANRGAAYVFAHSGSSWTQQATLTASDGSFADAFGYSVAVSGDTIVAGATGATVGGHGDQGAAYVFTQPAGGWANERESAKLTASDGGESDHLGTSVAVSGNTVVAGAPNATVRGNRVGAAYVFVEPPGVPPVGGWASESETGKLSASDGISAEEVGYSVAISGSTIVAGAPYLGQGAAYVFTQPGSAWSREAETTKLTASDRAGGSSVAISDNTVVAGAADPFTNGAPGAAHVFPNPPPLPGAVAGTPEGTGRGPFSPPSHIICSRSPC